MNKVIPTYVSENYGQDKTIHHLTFRTRWRKYSMGFVKKKNKFGINSSMQIV